jgi:hypothetical protein
MTLLVPERMLVFSPDLAAAIGLQEAVLLHVLHDLSTVQILSHAQWFSAELEVLERLLPFWNRAELQRISKNLVDQGILLVDHAPLTDGSQLRFQFHSGQTHKTPAHDATQARSKEPAFKTEAAYKNDHTRTAKTYSPADATTKRVSAVAEAPQAIRGASLLDSQWQPQEDTLQMLAMKNIPRQFALAQLEEFVFYWRERGKAEYAWDNKFRKHVIERWQKNLQQVAETEQPVTIALESIWFPSADALQILERTGISREFIEDTIPEFVLYWRERGDNTGTWNSKFIAHIRRQWARYSNALEHDQEPRPIAANWQPSEDVFDILRMANIDAQFACELLPEFILFWRDAGTPQRSWNTKFLQHTKYQWATRHHLASHAPLGTQGIGAQGAGYSLAIGAATQAPNSAFERLTDRSWASGIVDGV